MLVSYQLTFLFKNLRNKLKFRSLSRTSVQHLFQCQQPQVISTGIRFLLGFLMFPPVNLVPTFLNKGIFFTSQLLCRFHLLFCLQPVLESQQQGAASSMWFHLVRMSDLSPLLFVEQLWGNAIIRSWCSEIKYFRELSSCYQCQNSVSHIPLP